MKEINNNIKESYCSFEVSKLLKEKEFDVECLHFYTKPKSKMYGIDEHGRAYPIKNTSKKLYTFGQHASSKDDNVYLAPTHALAIEWIRVNFGIWIEVPHINTYGVNRFHIIVWKYNEEDYHSIYTEDGGYIVFDSPQEATEAALKYVLEILI